MYYVYLLEIKNNKSFYIGYTNNLKRRFLEHNSGKGGKTTRDKGEWILVYYEGYLNKKDAIGREKFLKSGSGRRYINKQLSNYLLNSSR